jgi:hypothetical protein
MTTFYESTPVSQISIMTTSAIRREAPINQMIVSITAPVKDTAAAPFNTMRLAGAQSARADRVSQRFRNEKNDAREAAPTPNFSPPNLADFL